MPVQQPIHQDRAAATSDRPPRTTAAAVIPDLHDAATIAAGRIRAWPAPLWRPTNLLATQRILGNQAVARLVRRTRGEAAVREPASRLAERPSPTAVQRLAVSERPVEAEKPPLKSITAPPEQGNKGMVFFLENEVSQKLVVKFQQEDPKESVIGTKFVQAAQAATPEIRVADNQDLTNLKRGLQPLLGGTFAKSVSEFETASTDSKKPHRVLMEYAEGKTIKQLYEGEPLKLVKVLADAGFQKSFGRVLASDVMSGNPDRAMAAMVPMSGREAFFNVKNLLVNEVRSTAGNYAAVAIDNAFSPVRPPFGHPFGFYGMGMGQIGSMAPANEQHLRTESEMIFEFVKELIMESLKNTAQAEQAEKALLAAKTTFVANVIVGADEALSQMLARGQATGWKARLGQTGASPQDVKKFQERKRLVRLLRLGVDVKDANPIAKDEDTRPYHKEILMKEKGLSVEKAEEVLAQGPQAYKALVRGH